MSDVDRFENEGGIALKDDDLGYCYFCGRELGPDWYCFGCDAYVCDACIEAETFGSHDVFDHKGGDW